MKIKLTQDSLLWPVPRANETMLKKTPTAIVECLLRLEVAAQVVFVSRTARQGGTHPRTFYTRLLSGTQLVWELKGNELELQYRGSDSQNRIIKPAAILTEAEVETYLEEVAAV